MKKLFAATLVAASLFPVFAGREFRKIERDYKRIKITDIQKTRYLNFFKSDLKPEYDAFRERIKFPARFPCIRNFHVLDDKIYIITFEESGVNSRILVFDLQGKLLKETWAPLADTNMLIPLGFNFYTFHRHKVYVLRENEKSEQWELLIQDIE
jgi:hypothetical protein